MTPRDWLLLVADAAQPRSLQPVQLQKCLFLLDRKLAANQKGMDRLYDFTPYDYGPFDSQVYRDAEVLQAEGLMAIGRVPGQTYKSYQITPAGHTLANSVAAALPAGIHDYTLQLVNWVQRLSFNDLVSAVYREFPDMKVNSVFKG